jgi:hypothetical protein
VSTGRCFLLWRGNRNLETASLMQERKADVCCSASPADLPPAGVQHCCSPTLWSTASVSHFLFFKATETSSGVSEVTSFCFLPVTLPGRVRRVVWGFKWLFGSGSFLSDRSFLCEHIMGCRFNFVPFPFSSVQFPQCLVFVFVFVIFKSEERHQLVGQLQHALHVTLIRHHAQPTIHPPFRTAQCAVGVLVAVCCSRQLTTHSSSWSLVHHAPGGRHCQSFPEHTQDDRLIGAAQGCGTD